jgi:protein-S-isoprenylcysteine O-methyltransferase Ste14
MARADMRWLAGQAVLLVVAFVVIPATDGIAGRLLVTGTRPAGYTIAAAGAIIGVVSMLRLGRQLVPQPTPVQGGELIESGIYGVVRHPIYLAVLLLIAGVVVRSLSLAGLAVLLVAIVFFDRKSAYEETLLTHAYPEYEDYRSRVRWKLVPGVR